MCPVSNTSVLKRLHFLKLERERATKNHNKDVIKYTIKNHFDIPIVSVEGKQCHKIGDDDKDGNSEYDIIDLQARKAKNNDNILFRLAVSSHSTFENDNEPADLKTCCLLESKSGETLGRVITVKDIGLSTSIYQYVDNENKALYQVYKKSSESEEKYYELHVKPVFHEDVIARINMEDDIISLSMAPELDFTVKQRLLSIMVFHHIILIKENTESTNN